MVNIDENTVQKNSYQVNKSNDIQSNADNSSDFSDIRPPSTVYKTSFNCSKAITFVDKSICTDPSLAQADIELNDLYRQLINQYPEKRQNLLISQRTWISNRDASCQDNNCILEQIKQRITELNEFNNILSSEYVNLKNASSSVQPQAIIYKTSFNCSKAITFVDKSICTDPSLAQADIELNDLYRQLINQYPEKRQSLLISQRTWINNRDASCQDNSCILEQIKQRIAELNEFR